MGYFDPDLKSNLSIHCLHVLYHHETLIKSVFCVNPNNFPVVDRTYTIYIYIYFFFFFSILRRKLSQKVNSLHWVLWLVPSNAGRAEPISFFKIIFDHTAEAWGTSLTRDQTHAPCSESVESYHQGSPWTHVFLFQIHFSLLHHITHHHLSWAICPSFGEDSKSATWCQHSAYFILCITTPCFGGQEPAIVYTCNDSKYRTLISLWFLFNI